MIRTYSNLLSKDYITAGANFNRWLVPPAALAIHLSIGMAYGFSVFWKPLQGALMDATNKPLASCAVGATSFGDKLSGTARALFATDCNWTQFDLGWMYTLFFVILGCSAALWGNWLERAGPRKAGLLATLCWCSGLLISALGIYKHQLWMLWLGSGVIGGIGLGLGYISPVSTLIKWFPDHRGMATGMAIMGFGGGAMVGSPLASKLMEHFATPSSVGVWQTFLVLAIIYFVFMLFGALSYRVPPADWQPRGWTPPVLQNSLVTSQQVHLKDAHKTPQFWLLWLVLCMNVSAGIGIIGAAAPMLQETFGGNLIEQPALSFTDIKHNIGLVALTASLGAAFVGLLSIFNILGRLGWATASDKLGRKTTYTVFFVLGIALYCTASYAANTKSLPLFIAVFCIIASMYGGGFATIPAYLADLFGTQFVGAIHGRLLTAWSTAGILGPVIVNYLHDTRLERGISYAQVYAPIFMVLASMLVLGLIANLLVQPVNTRYKMPVDKNKNTATTPSNSDKLGIRNTRDHRLQLAISWGLVLIPIAYGIVNTVQKAMAMM